MSEATKRITRKRVFSMTSLALDLLETAYAGPHACKRIARDAGVSHRTAQKWWGGINAMRADVLLRLAASNDKMRAELLARLETHGYVDTAGAQNAGAAVQGAGGSAGPACGLARSPAAKGEAHDLRVRRP